MVTSVVGEININICVTVTSMYWKWGLGGTGKTLTELQVSNLPSSSSSQCGQPPSIKQVLHGEHAALLVPIRFF